MGLRKYKRQIAKARMAAAGVGNVNKKMHIKDSDGVPNWRKALTRKAKRHSWNRPGRSRNGR